MRFDSLAGDVKNGCACPGPCCGDQTYSEMLAAMIDRYTSRELTEDQIRRTHLKWKKIAAEVR